MHQCPCCDYFTLAERGDYSICRVCFWEDDGLDIDELDQHSGPNHMTLREARKNFLELGACDLNAVRHVVPVKKRKRYAFEQRNV